MSGREDYEADVRKHPTYHDGTPRKKWDELPPEVQGTWNRQRRHVFGDNDTTPEQRAP